MAVTYGIGLECTTTLRRRTLCGVTTAERRCTLSLHYEYWGGDFPIRRRKRGYSTVAMACSLFWREMK